MAPASTRPATKCSIAVSSGNSWQIPSLVHRVWLGDHVPDGVLATEDAWRLHFPDYQLRLWRDADVERLGMPGHYWHARTYAERSDIARYRILWHCGGIYADCDLRPLQRFDHLWHGKDRLIVFHENSHLLLNGLIIARPHDQAIKMIIRFSDRNARLLSPLAAPNVRTGPFALTAAVDYARELDPSRIRLYPIGFVHVSGQIPGHAVASTPIQETPIWATVPSHQRNDGSSSKGVRVVREVLSDTMTAIVLLPLRVRRRLRRLGSSRRRSAVWR